MDIPLWVMCGAFTAWEVFAHFVARNKQEHTLSNRIWALEQKYPKSRVAVAGAVFVLFTHLVFQVP